MKKAIYCTWYIYGIIEAKRRIMYFTILALLLIDGRYIHCMHILIYSQQISLYNSILK